MMRSYLVQLGVGVGILLVSVAAFNWVVDPFGYYDRWVIQGFNAVKPAAADYANEVKPYVLAERNPQAVILGNSYSEVGLDPLHPGFAGDFPTTYNFGLRNNRWNHTLCDYGYVTSKLGSNLKRVLLGVRPAGMGDTVCSEAEAPSGGIDHAKLLLSGTAVWQSMRTLLHQDPADSSATREGRASYRRADPGARERFIETLHAPPMCRWDGRTPARVARFAAPETHPPLPGLTRLVEDAVGRGLDLTIIIHPKHAYFYEKLVLCGGAQEHWRRVWWIAKVVEDAAGDAGRIPVWYFTPYHRFMVEPVPSHDPMKYWQDPGHYNYELGDAIQDLVFDSYDADRGDVSDLGFRISTKNLARHYDRVHHERRAFLAANPDFLKGLAELMPQSPPPVAARASFSVSRGASVAPQPR
jgi:hypothetical protein